MYTDAAGHRPARGQNGELDALEVRNLVGHGRMGEG